MVKKGEEEFYFSVNGETLKRCGIKNEAGVWYECIKNCDTGSSEWLKMPYRDHIWEEWIKLKQKESYFIQLRKAILDDVTSGRVIVPNPHDTFNAFWYCPWHKLKVVIIGEKPYGMPEHDHGLAFSSKNKKCPFILENVLRETYNDKMKEIESLNTPKELKRILSKMRPCDLFPNYNLIPWAQQGVLLMNILLSCTQNNPMAHKGLGWENFAIDVIQKISQEKSNVVFMLWGKVAQHFKKYIANPNNHFILECEIPGKGNWHEAGHFRRANKYINEKHGYQHQIKWILET